jgi:hypothetical protein
MPPSSGARCIYQRQEIMWKGRGNLQFKREEENISALKVPRQCPHVCLGKVRYRKGKSL